MKSAFAFAAVLGLATSASGNEIQVSDRATLIRALHEAEPGDVIQVAPGVYRGGISASINGTEDAPVILKGADPDNRPVFEGGTSGFQFSDSSHFEIRDLEIRNVTGNGLNLDDGGSYETPSHHLTVSGLFIHDVGPGGNRDGIKLSGIVDFRIEDCKIERWGDSGSGIDMVGCHLGHISRNHLSHPDARVASGVQMKGGTSEITVSRCEFREAGARAINIGGSTGLEYFRPPDAPYEASQIVVEDCIFEGSQAPIAFVGVDGAIVRHNHIVNPGKWVLRILQETTGSRFVPCRNGVFTDNRIEYRSSQVRILANVGGGTEPESFQFARNIWLDLDGRATGADLPTPETGAADPESAGPR